eukprot:TRINITY_DN108276_c0_g1_i1.p1 TRINITY_DN108276_c0_g1~~TRINITY_DN108276_c0_g1_i1.p1  ORF type:complete len:552 (+),score=87.15 TRINITY_DN108276_c0_g1_i1:59-1714(+)
MLQTDARPGLVLVVAGIWGAWSLCGQSQVCCETDQSPDIDHGSLVQLLQTSLQLKSEGSSHSETEGPDKSGPEDKATDGVEVDAGNNGYDSTQSILSVFLMGFAILLMWLIYLLNWPGEGIRRETLKILDSTLTIFSAMLLFSAIKDVSAHLFNEYGQPDSEVYMKPYEYSAILPMAYRFLVIDGTFVILLMFLRWRKHQTAAVATMGGYVVAFAGIDAFGSLQQCLPFAKSPVSSFGAVVVSAIILMFLLALHSCFLKCLASMLTSTEWQETQEETFEVEDNMVSLILSLLICQVIKFTIVGHITAIYGYSKGESIRQVLLLFGVAMAFAFAALLLVGIWQRLLRRTPTSTRVRKEGWANGLLVLILNTLTFTVAWCLLYSAQWLFCSITQGSDAGDDKMLARIIIAAAVSALGIVVIFLLRCCADQMIGERNSFQTLINAVGLLLGLTWEQAFDTAVQSTAEAFGEGQSRLVTGSTLFVFWLVVIPAWALYIRPVASAHGKETESDDGESENGPRSSNFSGGLGAFSRPLQLQPCPPVSKATYNRSRAS